MSWFSRLRKKEEPPSSRDFDARLAAGQQAVVQAARDQSFQLKIVKETEAASIAQACGLSRKRNDPAAFVDVALMLLTYPPELANFIAAAFSQFAPQVGFDPFHPIQRAIARLESLSKSMVVDRRLLEDKPELFGLLSNQGPRVEKTAEYLAAAFCISCNNVQQGRRLFEGMAKDCDPTILEALRAALMVRLPQVAEHVLL